MGGASYARNAGGKLQPFDSVSHLSAALRVAAGTPQSWVGIAPGIADSVGRVRSSTHTPGFRSLTNYSSGVAAFLRFRPGVMLNKSARPLFQAAKRRHRRPIHRSFVAGHLAPCAWQRGIFLQATVRFVLSVCDQAAPTLSRGVKGKRFARR